MAFARLRLSVLMTVAVIVVFVGLLWPFFPAGLMSDWMIVLLTVAAARYGMWSAFTRFDTGSRLDTRWSWAFAVAAALAGASWSFGAVTLMPEAGQTESMLLCLTLLAVTAVSMVTLTAQPAAMYCFQMTALLPTGAALYATGGEVEGIGAAIVVAGTLVLMIVGRGSGASTRSLLETELRLSGSIRETEEARSRAEAASQAKSQFLATMSHEIRTPMNGVLGITELLLTSNLDDGQRQWATAVHNSGLHLLGVINDILDFSKIESGKMDLETVDFSLVDVVEEAIAMFARPAEAKGLVLACQFSPPEAPFAFRGDPFRLRQVVANLLGNAVKFTARGEVVVKVSIRDSSRSRALLQISVHDTGCGIPEASLQRIFEHFAQADGSTTRQFGGTGLGLAICRRLLALMGGTLQVNSAIGVGSTFSAELTLPIAPDPAPALTTLAGVRVLVAVDHDTSREILEKQLAGWGMRVTCAPDGTQALQTLADAVGLGTPFELVILDLQQRGMDGLELARSVRNAPALAATPLVMFGSTYIHPDDATRMSAGLRSYLNKPVRRAELFSALRGALVSDSTAAPAVEHSGAGKRALRTPLRGRVLLVEDNDINLLLASAMLGNLGLSPVRAENGAEAVALVQSSRFDLILMDCQMPVMDGFQATAAIRALPDQHAATVPIIALTANAMPGDEEACLQAGMNDFLAKPFSLQTLHDRLSHWLDPKLEPATVQSPDVRNTPVITHDHGAINPNAIQTLLDLDTPGSSALLKQLATSFLTSAPRHLERMDEAVRTGNCHALKQVAHSWKSSAANLGADDLAAYLKEIEHHARNGKLDAAQMLIEPARAAQQQATRALEAIVQGLHHAVSERQP